MTYAHPEALVSTEWLAAHISAPDVRIVDATWNNPSKKRPGRDEYEQSHIHGAVFFDLEDISDSASSLPNMLPESVKFSSKVRRLGLGNGNRLVIYDRSSGSSAAARVWWMFRFFGHREVSILDGGMEKWLAEGRPTEDLPPVPRERHFTPHIDHLLLREKDYLIKNIQSKHDQVIDARSAARFQGKEAEPWPCNKIGHIPGSKNLPWNSLIDPESKTFLPANRLAKVFSDAGIDVHKPTTVTCGSGVTACMLALGIYLLGNKEVSVYDGSWAEWGSASDTPVEA